VPRVLLAPGPFKGTLTASQVAAALAAGVHDADPALEIVTAPVADGGDGLLDALAAGGFERVAVRASDAVGEPVGTSWLRRGDRAVVELAAVCGLALLGPRREPLDATSRGLGEVMAAALSAGCRRLLVGIGGSASTDGGIGMLQALGARVLDAAGRPVAPGGRGAETVARLDLTGLHPALHDPAVEVACDVDNPLTGPSGAAAVYGPQKGATAADVRRLDAALGRWADAVAAATGHDLRDTPGAGAAGGVGFGAAAVLGAVLRPGADLVLDAIGLDALLAHADLVVTGEGALDEQTLRGKAPARVAAAARRAGVPVVAVAGRCRLDAAALRGAGFAAVHTLAGVAAYPEQPMREPETLLRRLGTAVAAEAAAAVRRRTTAAPPAPPAAGRRTGPT